MPRPLSSAARTALFLFPLLTSVLTSGSGRDFANHVSAGDDVVSEFGVPFFEL